MTTTQQPVLSRSRINLALGALALGAFTIGSAELVVVGVLNLIAGDLAVSISTAGTLVTSYALGIAVGGPVLTAVTIRFGRRPLLLVALGAYLIGNLIAAFAVNFAMLLGARILTGSLHGLFIGVAFAIGAGLLPPERLGRAISMVFGGIAVATALGVPLGTLVGQAWGWQASFIAIVGAGSVALAMMLVYVPDVPNSGIGGFTAQARHALAPRVLAVLGLGFLIMGGEFAALTYLQPFLADVTGISGPMISIFLLVYGIANAVGTFLGGAAADRDASRTLTLATAVLVLALGGLYLWGSNPVAAALALAVWGVVGFGLVPSLQYRVVSLAGPGRDFAAMLPASAVTAGIAVGALVGGRAVDHSGASAAVLTGTALMVLAVPVAWATRFLKPPSDRTRGDVVAQHL